MNTDEEHAEQASVEMVEHISSLVCSLACHRRW